MTKQKIQKIQIDTDLYCVDHGGGKSSSLILIDESPTLTTTHYGEPVIIYGTNTEETKPNNWT